MAKKSSKKAAKTKKPAIKAGPTAPNWKGGRKSYLVTLDPDLVDRLKAEKRNVSATLNRLLEDNIDNLPEL